MQIDVEKLTVELLQAGQPLSISRAKALEIAGIGETQLYDRIKRGELPQSKRGRFYLPLFIACLQDPDFLRKTSTKPGNSEMKARDSEIPEEIPTQTLTWTKAARKR